ncbi:hypothetical protein R3P38DRAFT_3043955 [Favolaschia claudopus]|uniref:Histone-lysine N-methyltransferase n=1 Tax=Favolaschia claudopus TaxID=2862362 RepID=A0AAV9Z430_9AGAR
MSRRKRRKPPPESDTEPYELDAVVGEEVRNGTTFFLVRWKGYGPESDDWKKEEDVQAPELVERFRAESQSATQGASSGPSATDMAGTVSGFGRLNRKRSSNKEGKRKKAVYPEKSPTSPLASKLPRKQASSGLPLPEDDNEVPATPQSTTPPIMTVSPKFPDTMFGPAIGSIYASPPIPSAPVSRLPARGFAGRGNCVDDTVADNALTASQHAPPDSGTVVRPLAGKPSNSFRDANKRPRSLSLDTAETPSKRKVTASSEDAALVPTKIADAHAQVIADEWNEVARQSGVPEIAKITFINEIDHEPVPPDINTLFTYLEKDCLSSVEVPNPPKAETMPCIGRHPAFTDEIIIECGQDCSAASNCKNRVTQLPRTIPIEIFKTVERGWAARSAVPLVRGQVLGLYTGSRSTASKLIGADAAYIFQLDMDEPQDADPSLVYSVDAFRSGNWTRYINHSCSPNTAIIPVARGSAHESLPYTLAFVATQDIVPLAELTLDYDPSEAKTFARKKYRGKSRSKILKRKRNQTPCKCGTLQCRGWLPQM